MPSLVVIGPQIKEKQRECAPPSLNRVKTRSDEILAKLINHGVAAVFSHQDVPKVLKILKFSSA